MMKCLSIIICAFLVIQSASADWESPIKLTVKGKSSVPESLGMMRMKDERIRMDMTSPMPISSIIDLKGQKVWSMLTAQKIVMENDLSKIAGQAPLCGTKNIEACLTKQGLKKTGKEKIYGHPCTVYEGTLKGAQDTKMKLWKPDKLTGVPSLRTVSTDKDGTVVTAEFTDVKIKKQDEAQFSVPKDYRSISGMQDLLKGMLGK